MMAHCNDLSMLSLLVICWLQFQAGFVASQGPNKGQKPTNITITSGARSMVVTWDPPAMKFNQSFLESYRVRVFKGDDPIPMRVYWVRKGSPLRETITCLEPGTLYRIQVFARFVKESNLTDKRTEAKHAMTQHDPEYDFLDEAIEQKVFIGLGAGLAAGCCLIIWSIWCCCRSCRRSKSATLNNCKEDKSRGKKKKKKNGRMPPSAKELQDIEQGHRMGTVGSAQSTSSRTRSQPLNASSSSTARLVPSSIPSNRPFMPPPIDDNDAFDDDVFESVYQNTAAAPPSYPADDMPFYGNLNNY